MSSVQEDISQMMDKAGLTASNLKTTREPTEKIVSRIRTELLQEIIKYMKERGDEKDTNTI